MTVKKTPKSVLLALLVALACFKSSAMEFAPEKQVYLGLDHIGMLWYIVDYGIKEDGTPFAVTRRYYTNEHIRQEIVGLLITNFGHSEEVAGSLYFTEYGYEYTQDGRQFALTYVRHHDQLGGYIHGTVFDGSCESSTRTYSDVVPTHAVGRALTLIMQPAATRR